MGVLVAIRFLTALPLPDSTVKPAEMGRSAAYFPLVGLLLGCALAALDASLRLVLPTTLSNVILLIALVLLTGGLHLDGLMDSCDGLFGRRDPALRLEIMRDSRVGGFGVLGAFCLLLLKLAALGEMSDFWRLSGLVLMPTLGRWAMVLAIRGFPYARAEGLGRAFKEGVGRPQVVVATLTAAAVAAATIQPAGILAFFVAGTATWLLGTFVCTRIPGLTGDSYGAINEVVEVATLLTVIGIARASGG